MMKEENDIFQTCSKNNMDTSNRINNLTITFISNKGLDLLSFSILQTIRALVGLEYGSFQLPPVSQVLFVDGYKSADSLNSEFATYEYANNLSQIKMLSMKEYNSGTNGSTVDPDIPVVDNVVADQLVALAKPEEYPCVIFRDLHSLSAAGTLCKAVDFANLHNRLKAQGALQMYFVNTEAEARQIAVEPDLIFTISKISNTIHPSIRLSLSGASARLQDTILPVELELHFNQNGTWKVESAMNRQDQEDAIKLLAILGRTRKQIATSIGDISETTVGRRLHAMESNGEIVIQGHRVLRS